MTGLEWMTGMDDWHGWLLDWILYIGDKLTDGRTLLVVKSLTNLKQKETFRRPIIVQKETFQNSNVIVLESIK